MLRENNWQLKSFSNNKDEIQVVKTRKKNKTTRKPNQRGLRGLGNRLSN